MAVCSSSQNAKRVLKILKLESFFHAIMTGKEISRAKPDPQIFLLAASRLNVKPKDGLIFEDAVSGIQAAIKESMSVIGIGTTGNLKGPLLRIKVFSNQNQRKIEQVIGTFFN